MCIIAAMPELPEVETIARGLRAALVGHAIRAVEVRWAGTVAAPAPAAFRKKLRGCMVRRVERRGKWLLIDLSSGETLLVHLRMSGRMLLGPAAAAGDPHTRVVLTLGDGRRVCFCDTRKFGRMLLTADPGRVLDALGPEPLGDAFTPAALRRMLAGRRSRIKPLLLDQRFVAGLGNIYVDESLWRAGIHPLRRADTLSRAEAARLCRAVRRVLRAAIRQGGTTLEDESFVGTGGEAGRFAVRLAVYGRAGKACPRCAATVERIVVAQRGTHFCPRCQPARSGPVRKK